MAENDEDLGERRITVREWIQTGGTVAIGSLLAADKLIPNKTDANQEDLRAMRERVQTMRDELTQMKADYANLQKSFDALQRRFDIAQDDLDKLKYGRR